MPTFTYELTITNVSPVEGGLNGGTELTIIGENFSSESSSNTVYINGIECTVISSTNSEIKCLTGASTESGAF